MLTQRRISLILVLALAAIYVWREWPGSGSPGSTAEAPHQGGPAQAAPDNAGLLAAIRARRSDVLVEGTGEVVFLFRDDLRGSRHQMFLVRIGRDATVKISHNIDLAERVPLRKGQRVRFKGEFEWNAKGGVVHWTHHDPAGRRPGGFIEHDGKRYE